MYSRDVLNKMIFLSKITKKMSNQFYDFISQYIDNAREQLIQIIKPNGMLPGIGDSESYSGRDVLKYACSNVEKYKSIFCYENVDEYLMKNDIVFDKGGYAIFRSSWNDKADEATWMLFNAATFSSTHKHGDDLEVLLYHKGDLFVEGGKRDYNYLDEKTAWSYSSFAHNVLVVNDKPFPVKIGSNGFQSIYPEALDTKIVDYDIEDEVKSVCGYQKRYEGIEQYRTLEYDKENNIIRIIDDIKANMIYNGSLLWHIDPEVVVVLEKNDIKFFRNDENIAIAHIESDSAYDIEMIQGEGEYPYYTYTFANGEQRNGGLLKINFVGDEITKIVLNIELK